MTEIKTNNSPSLTLGIHSELDFGEWRSPLLLVVETDPASQKQAIYAVIQQRRFEFNAVYDNNKAFSGFTAAYHNKTGDPININELISSFIPTVADVLPKGLTFSLQDIFLAYQKIPNASEKHSYSDSESKTAFLIGATLGLDISLTDLPLIGDKLPSDFAPSINSFQVLYAHQTISPELTNTLLPKSITHSKSKERPFPDGLAPGLYLSACLNFDGDRQWTTLTLTGSKSASQPRSKTPIPSKSSPKSANLSASQTLATQNPSAHNSQAKNITNAAMIEKVEKDKIFWYPLNKNLGSINFDKVGIQFQNSELWFFLNATLSVGGLTLSCNGLGVGSSLTKFKPKFRLDGIGIHYAGSDCLEIGGALLRKTITREENGKVTSYDEEYSGAVVIGAKIKEKKLTLSAIGSYTEVDGEASLFVFALLDYPLGGIPAFFVTGLAAGFGYNRLLKVPETVEEVEDFPLVKLAMGEEDEKKDLLGILHSLGPYIQPASGEMFFAIGIKFTSFKIIDAFVLLIVKLGKRTEFHILGLATLIAPSPENAEELGIEAIAEAKLTLKAVYIPDEGVLRIEGNLQQGSYLFSQKCHLSGGFAFYSWFSGEHKGDFVLTLGGYHPKFKVPSHYPQVPRFKLDWKLNDNLAIKGEGYFALTSSALMAGGCLEATYKRKNITAYFKIEAHFLIAWQPFYYEATVALEIKTTIKTWWKSFTLEIRASLELWGPPFSGKAVLEIGFGLCSVEMRFGSNLPPHPKALTWKEFKASLLPSDSEICSIAVDDGLIRKIEYQEETIETIEEWVLNPKDFTISTNSVIPSTHSQSREEELEQLMEEESDKKVSIRPMNLDKLVSTHKIEIIRKDTVVNNDKDIVVNDDFAYTAILNKVPSALWGEGFIPTDVNASQFVENALCGFTITPAKPPQAGKSQDISYKKLLLNSSESGGKWQWETADSYQPKLRTASNTEKMGTEISMKSVHEKRQQLLENLGFSPETDVTINESFINELLDEPHLISL